MPTWLLVTLAVLSGLSTISTIIFGVFVAWLSQKSRADFAEFNNAMVETIRRELKEYLLITTFNTYVKTHAEEELVKNTKFEEFMVRHRDWKHDMEPWVRGVDMTLSDMSDSKHIPFGAARSN